jgi:dipeptidyl aminopeptidase/acylaminoacyl peptidase
MTARRSRSSIFLLMAGSRGGPGRFGRAADRSDLDDCHDRRRARENRRRRRTGDLVAYIASGDQPSAGFLTPRPVSFVAADGIRVQGQIFGITGPAKPGIIFVHGGPPRQMLLGWHYMAYYSNAYAVNQYLAAHGFVVLALNYRLGIWGGSYEGYLTALALARNSDIFNAGVDLHGVHDWSRLLEEWTGKTATRFERGDREKALEVAWHASPVSAMDDWRSPVLLIHGDDDRNVPFEKLILPNEIHGFLRHASWLRADQATVELLDRTLGVKDFGLDKL